MLRSGWLRQPLQLRSLVWAHIPLQNMRARNSMAVSSTQVDVQTLTHNPNPVGGVWWGGEGGGGESIADPQLHLHAETRPEENAHSSIIQFHSSQKWIWALNRLRSSLCISPPARTDFALALATDSAPVSYFWIHQLFKTIYKWFTQFCIAEVFQRKM